MLHFKTGAVLNFEERGDYYRESFGAPFWHIHRADKIDLLAAALPPGQEIRFAHRLLEVTQEGDEIVTHFDNGQSCRCDVLIACDGLKSPVRQQLFDQAPPEFTGFVAWRGLVPRAALTQHRIEPDFTIYPGPRAMVGRYAVRNRTLVNFVAIAQQPDWQREGWMEPADLDEVRASFAGWHSSVTDMFDAVDPAACFKWALHVRRPLECWVNGRVALLGDAAHPMTPFLGLGAAMGIEDAWVLARCFAVSASPEEALSRYQSARVARANRVQKQSQQQGLYLLNMKPGDPPDGNLMGEDPMGLYAYDATRVSI
jgi:salicylate hydroxylase